MNNLGIEGTLVWVRASCQVLRDGREKECRRREASGSSGMNALVHGGMNLF